MKQTSTNQQTSTNTSNNQNVQPSTPVIGNHNLAVNSRISSNITSSQTNNSSSHHNKQEESKNTSSLSSQNQSHSNPLKYLQKYKQIQTIGKGTSGHATLVKFLSEDQFYISKKINLMTLGQKEKNSALQEYCEQGDMSFHIKLKRKQNQHYTEKEILNWFLQISLALSNIHSEKVMHRDIKTSNIFLTSCGSVKIGDFGIAKILDCSMQKMKTVVGTPYYLSPEVCENKPYTIQSDIWALGCVLYQLCALEHPFQATNLMGLVYQIIGEQIPEIPSIYSKELSGLVKQLLNKNPDQRPLAKEILSDPLMLKTMQDFVKLNGKIQGDNEKVPIKQFQIHQQLSTAQKVTTHVSQSSNHNLKTPAHSEGFIFGSDGSNRDANQYSNHIHNAPHKRVPGGVNNTSLEKQSKNQGRNSIDKIKIPELVSSHSAKDPPSARNQNSSKQRPSSKEKVRASPILSSQNPKQPGNITKYEWKIQQKMEELKKETQQIIKDSPKQQPSTPVVVGNNKQKSEELNYEQDPLQKQLEQIEQDVKNNYKEIKKEMNSPMEINKGKVNSTNQTGIAATQNKQPITLKPTLSSNNGLSSANSKNSMTNNAQKQTDDSQSDKDSKTTLDTTEEDITSNNGYQPYDDQLSLTTKSLSTTMNNQEEQIQMEKREIPVLNNQNRNTSNQPLEEPVKTNIVDQTQNNFLEDSNASFNISLTADSVFFGNKGLLQNTLKTKLSQSQGSNQLEKPIEGVAEDNQIEKLYTNQIEPIQEQVQEEQKPEMITTMYHNQFLTTTQNKLNQPGNFDVSIGAGKSMQSEYMGSVQVPPEVIECVQEQLVGQPEYLSMRKQQLEDMLIQREDYESDGEYEQDFQAEEEKVNQETDFGRITVTNQFQALDEVLQLYKSQLLLTDGEITELPPARNPLLNLSEIKETSGQSSSVYLTKSDIEQQLQQN